MDHETGTGKICSSLTVLEMFSQLRTEGYRKKQCLSDSGTYSFTPLDGIATTTHLPTTTTYSCYYLLLLLLLLPSYLLLPATVTYYLVVLVLVVLLLLVILLKTEVTISTNPEP